MRIVAPLNFTPATLRRFWADEIRRRIHRLCEARDLPDERRGAYPAIDLRASTDKKGTP